MINHWTKNKLSVWKITKDFGFSANYFWYIASSEEEASLMYAMPFSYIDKVKDDQVISIVNSHNLIECSIASVWCRIRSKGLLKKCVASP